MNVKPILFNGEMVRALLDGRKTQTRRVIKPQPKRGLIKTAKSALWRYFDREGVDPSSPDFPCPYGQPGDLLWVRETFGVGSRPDPFEGSVDGIEYRADEAYLDKHDQLPLYPISAPDDYYADNGSGWKPSIFMPRWANRITLRLTDVRVERIQDATWGDCRSEGADSLSADAWDLDGSSDPYERAVTEGYRIGFQRLWDSINAKRGYGWDANPWVWALTFEVIQQNVDEVIKEGLSHE